MWDASLLSHDHTSHFLWWQITCNSIASFLISHLRSFTKSNYCWIPQEVRVRFSGFSYDQDEWVNVKRGVRERSIPLEPSECHRVEVGDLVLCFRVCLPLWYVLTLKMTWKLDIRIFPSLTDVNIWYTRGIGIAFQNQFISFWLSGNWWSGNICRCIHCWSPKEITWYQSLQLHLCCSLWLRWCSGKSTKHEPWTCGKAIYNILSPWCFFLLFCQAKVPLTSICCRPAWSSSVLSN